MINCLVENNGFFHVHTVYTKIMNEGSVCEICSILKYLPVSPLLISSMMKICKAVFTIYPTFHACFACLHMVFIIFSLVIVDENHVRALVIYFYTLQSVYH